MTTRRPPGLRGYAHVVGYRLFYRLPGGVRRRLVRLAAPTYTLGAVTIVLDATSVDPAAARTEAAPAGGRILLLRQPHRYGWGLPGGLIDRGETPDRCAARELAEETGIRLPPEQLTPAVPNAVVHSAGRWVDTVFLARIDPAGHEVVVDGAEVLEAAWFPLTDLPRLTPSTARLVGRYGIGPLADPSEPSKVDS